MMGPMDCLDAKYRAFQWTACQTIQTLVAARLAELEARFPRHKFTILDGMGSTILSVEPSVMRQTNLDEVYFPTAQLSAKARGVIGEIFAAQAFIEELATVANDDYKVSLGHIDSKGEIEI